MSKQTSIANNNSNRLVKSQIDREYFRQVRTLFYAATISATVSVCVTLVGMFGNAPESSELIIGGLVSSIRSIRLAQSANDRLDKISDDLNDE